MQVVESTVESKIHVVAILSPFQTNRRIWDLPAGGAVDDILVAIGLPKDVPARIFVGDRLILDGDRGFKPAPGDLVTIRALPGAPAALALLVVLASAAASQATIALGTGLASSVLASTFAGSVVATGVGILGKLLISALVPPPSPPKGNTSSIPAIYSISGPSNALTPYAPVPRVYAGPWWQGGGRKVSPMIAGQSFTEVSGNDQYLRLLLTCGYGPLDMTGLRIAESILTNYADIQYETRCGYPDDAPLTLYTNDIDEQDVNVLLLDTGNKNTTPTGWQTLTSGINADELSVDFTCPQGLQTINDVGNHRQLTVVAQCRFAPTGTTAWTYVGQSAPDVNGITDAYVSSDSNTALILAGVSGDIVRLGLVWPVARGQYDVQLQVVSVTWLPNRDLLDTFFGQTFWTALRTIRHIDPIAMPGVSKIALRIRATNQLNGPVTNFSAIVGSILKDWDPVASSWESRAGSWDYDYDLAGAGASAYGLDTSAPHTPGGRALQITTAGGSDKAGVASRPIPALGWAQTKAIVSGWYKASAAAAQGARLRIAFGADDNFQTGSWQDYVQGTAYDIGATITPTLNNPGPFVAGLGYIATGYTYRCIQAGTATSVAGSVGWNQAIKGTTNIGGGCVFQNVGGPTLVYFDIGGANLAVTTDWQQISQTITLPYNAVQPWAPVIVYEPGEVVIYVDGNKYLCLVTNASVVPSTHPNDWRALPKDVIVNANFMRVIAYNDGAGAGITVSWDDLQVQVQPSNTQILPNASFDYPGAITANPASHYRDALQGRCNKRPVPDGALDLPTLQAWHEYAKAGGHFFNGVLDKSQGLFDSLRTIAAVGRAGYFMRDGLYSVVLDQAQSSPIQHFSPRNSWGFKSTKALPDIPQALRMRFSNAALDYRTDEILVYDDGYGPTAAPGIIAAQYFEAIDLTAGVCAWDPQPGITNLTGLQPWRDGRYHLAQARLRPETYQLTTDFENVVCTRGDLVYVEHDVPQWGLGAGRVTAVTLSGDTVTEVQTDETFFGDGVSTYALRIRAANGDSYYSWVGAVPASGQNIFAVYNGTYTGLQPAVGDLVMFGLVNLESVQLLVTVIEPSTDLTAIIYLQDYSPAIYTAEGSAMPGFVSQVAAPQPALAAPVIVGTRSDETVMIRHSDGSLN